MAKAEQIFATVAARTGLPLTQVQLTARRLREADLFVRETKSKNSPRATTRHCAHLIIALLSGQPAKQAPAVIELAENIFVDDDSIRNLIAKDDERPRMPSELEFVYKYSHSFVYAVDCLLRLACRDPYRMVPEAGPHSGADVRFDISFSYEKRSADISFTDACIPNHDMPFRSKLSAGDPNPKFDAHLFYLPDIEIPSGDFTMTGSITQDTIKSIGEVMARSEW